MGGGYRDDLLSQIPLHWILEKASRHGLTFRADVILEPGVLEVRPRDSYSEFGFRLYRYATQPFYRIIGAPSQSSKGERDDIVNETIDASVFERWRADATDPPPNLIDWARRYGVKPGAMTDSVFTHEPPTFVPETQKADAHSPSA